MNNDKPTLMSAVEALCRHYKSDPDCFSSRDRQDLDALLRGAHWLLSESCRGPMTEARHGQAIRNAHRLREKLERKWNDHQRRTKANFNPAQPRVPAGNSDGGEWTDSGGGNGDGITSESIREALRTRTPGSFERIGAVASTSRDMPLPETPAKPSRPEYRPGISPVTPKDWNTYHDNLGKAPNLSETEHRVYATVFAAEGGYEEDLSIEPPAVSGITQDTLNSAKKDPLLADKLKGVHKPSALIKQPELVPHIYKNYFDENLKEIGGSAGLDLVGNKYAAAAMADTIFREGRPKGAKILREAIGNVDRPIGNLINQSDGFTIVGNTLHAYSYLAQDPAKVNLLLDETAKARKAHRQGETARPNYFRFEKERGK